MTERLLTDDPALANHGWRARAACMVQNGDALGIEVEANGIALASGVALRLISVDGLWQAVRYVNELDGRATKALRDLDLAVVSCEDHLEATAARLANQAGRWALKQVKTDSRLDTFAFNTDVRAHYDRALLLVTGNGNGLE